MMFSTSAPEVREEPEQDRQNDTDDKARDDRKVKRCVLAAMDNIPGQAAKAERQSRSEIKENSNDGADSAKDQKGPSEFAEWVHDASLKPLRFEVKASRIA
jgi:hypothetical protein